ncbi:MAG TPA: carbonic anhydrase [Stellaceae bacterium]|nr:carbonic anhydrase [Stellaceae bacterium]
MDGMQKLLAGYRRFRAKAWPEQRRLFETLAREGQRPNMLLVACIDSRVDPAMIFDTAPGEVLTVRNVANLVPPYAPDAAYHGTSAALEFGVSVLGVEHIVVLGHGACGGVQALLDGAPPDAADFIAPWMSLAEPARVAASTCPAGAERQRRCEYEIVKLSLANLMTFPWIAAAAGTGKLALHGAWFAVDSGTLVTLQPDGSFASPD